MPTAYIKKLADEGKGSVAELEKKWDEAKTDAAKQGQGDNFAYVTKIFQNRAGVKANIDIGGYVKTEIVSGDNAYLDSLVESGQFTREQVDEAWAKAKKIADQNKAENPNIQLTYAYTTSIFQDLLGIKQKASMRINAAQRLKAAQGNMDQAVKLLESLGFKGAFPGSSHDNEISVNYHDLDRKVIDSKLGKPQKYMKFLIWKYKDLGSIVVLPNARVARITNKVS